jgi:hypothetical protein
LEELTPDELAARYLARFDWRRSRSREPRPPGDVLSAWEEWIASDPEKAWLLFEALVRLRPDDDDVLEQVWHRLEYLLARQGRAFEPRVRALVGGNARLRRIAPKSKLDAAAHRPRPLNLSELVQTYIRHSQAFDEAHEVDVAVREEPARGLRLALEIISRGPLHEFTSYDSFSPLLDLLRMHGSEVIDAVEDAASASVLVRRCLWRMSAQQSDPPGIHDVPADVWARVERAMNGTTDYNTDDPLGVAHSLTPEDERVIDAWFVREDAFWAWDRVGDIVREDPELAWRVTTMLVHDAPTDSVLGAVAAGPLEDFLGLHGVHFIERVETLAQRDTRFRESLQGVWQGSMSEAVWARVQRAASGD